jgi:hypothetical protein
VLVGVEEEIASARRAAAWIVAVAVADGVSVEVSVEVELAASTELLNAVADSVAELFPSSAGLPRRCIRACDMM